MTRSARWDTTVQEIVLILRDALSALIPIAERANLPWRDGEAYDDWDAIASILYERIVVGSIVHAVGTGSGLALPKYDLVYPSYTSHDLISVELAGVPEGTIAVFIGFAGTQDGFTHVKWVSVTQSGQVVDPTIHVTAYADCSFILLQRTSQSRIRVSDISVEL